MKNFGHSGDLGDIIYSLPTIRALGGGRLVLFHYPGRTAHGMSKQKVDRIKPLLECQDYITEVVWSDGFADHPLNGFRDHRSGNLADMHLSTHGLGWQHRVKKWLTVDPLRIHKIIVNRTPRYQNNRFDWKTAIQIYARDMAFVGTPEEYDKFCNDFAYIPYQDAPDLLSVARLIAGCEMFIGNYSCAAAICEGLKHKMILEVCPDHRRPLAIFERMNCVLGWDEKIEWPDI